MIPEFLKDITSIRDLRRLIKEDEECECLEQQQKRDREEMEEKADAEYRKERKEYYKQKKLARRS